MFRPQRPQELPILDTRALFNSTGNATFDPTLFPDPGSCTLETCPLDWASMDYIPSLGGNVFYLLIFGAFFVVQLYSGIRYRTWTFLAALIGGLVLEIVGYIARVQMHFNPFRNFLTYLVTLTIAPCFLTAAIYLCLTRIILVYGEHLARFKARTYTILFICCDIFSLVLQAAGGGLAETADTKKEEDKGINLMIAGLVFQVVSLAVFVALCADFGRKVLFSGADPRTALISFVCSKRRWYAFLIALSVATLTIFIRSCFRVAELSEGFQGKLANDEATFMILEGAMIIIASLALTIFHPALIFKRSWKLNSVRAAAGERYEQPGQGAPLQYLK